MTVMNVQLLGDNAVAPTVGHKGSAGYDIYSAESVIIGSQPQEVSTELAIAIPEGCVGLILPRSGLAFNHGVDTLAGVIDHGYTGEIKVLLIRHSHGKHNVKKGDRIAQLVIQKFEKVNIMAVEKLDDSERGSNGFGSSGK